MIISDKIEELRTCSVSVRSRERPPTHRFYFNKHQWKEHRMGRSRKNDVYQVTFILNLLLVPFGILIFLAGIAVDHNMAPYSEFFRGKLHALSLCLIAAGLFSIAVALFGCYGVLRDRFCIIMLYPHLLLAILVFQMVVAGLAYVQKEGQEEILDSALEGHIQNYTWDSENMDILQTELKCCGFNSSDDYYDISVPLSCCDNYNCSIDISYYKKGCKSALESFTTTQGNIISGVSLTFAGLEISGFIYLLFCCRRMMLEKSPSTHTLLLEESSDEETKDYP